MGGKKDQHEIELYKDFQERRNLHEDVISFTVNYPLYAQEPKGLDFFSLLLFESGSGTHTIDGIAYKIEPKQLHFLYPGQLHSWNIYGDVKIHVVFVSGKIFSRFGNYFVYPIEYFKNNPIVNLGKECYSNIFREVLGIKNEVRIKEGLREIVFSRLRIIAMLVGREIRKTFEDKKYGKNDATIARFTLLVNSNFRQQRKVQFYASTLMITANYLNILCNKHLGMTAKAFIAQEIINEMKSELLISKKPIKQIASEMNFIDLSTFSTYFKTHTGYSPSDYVMFNKELVDRSDDEIIESET